MRKEDLSKAVAHFEEILCILNANKLSDSKVRSRYAEFLVARKLAEIFPTVQILDERDVRSADIYIPSKGPRVEVKSGLYVEDEEGVFSANASFGSGNQIGKKFDFCVFVTFDQCEPQEFFIFSSKELEGVKKSKRKIGAFENNQCLLVRYRSYDEYKKYFERQGRKQDMLEIEIKLHKHPEEYQHWDKIR